jgi:hypothetical protein
MKIKKTLAFMALPAALLMLVLVSCNQKKSDMEVLTSRIQYDVPVSNDNPDLDWWVNNIEGSKRDPFIKRIMDAAASGEVKAYDYFNKPLTVEEVQHVGIDSVYKTLVHTTPPYDKYDTLVITKHDYRDVKKIRFLEEWKWNPKTLQMDKKVIGIAPLILRRVGDETYNELLFWVYLEDGYPAKL